ncbi:hypothetical protein PACTADRAFT_40116 [Pachysolen tannophilus NRRL Y-2460]|uniref:non-specific serine/threonine protein kinase n=1 Tax=Pachysolen tannophilus NRRL Y-2460 TaxID=669874 RepID=A0A1E4TYD2_PACTA|nr:hypothetical protein PACTADRAFT_40116 [Pachysolen tannophilus NRRL Y-2460]
MESLNLGNGADNNVITAELDNNNPIQVVAPIPNPNPVATGPEKSVSSTSSATSKARPGLLTVKIYNGNNIRLPIPLKINKPVLSKLAQTGVGVDTETLENTIDQLLFVANNNNDYKKTDVGLLMTQSLPSLASIPTTNNYINNSPTTSTKKALLYLIVEFDNNTETIESSGSTIHSPKFNNVTTFDVSNSLNYLNVQVFARLPGMLIPEDDQSKSDDEFDQQQKVHQPNNSLQQDILIGNCKIPLSNKNLSNNEKGTRLINHEWVSIINPYSKLSMGFVNLTIDFKYLPKKSLTINDFDLLKVIGKGSFGKVMQVRKIDTGKIYALKSIRKTHIVSKMEVTHTLAEKFVLSKVDNPFIVPLKFAFQSPEKLYLVLAFINGGELFYHLQQSRRFSLVRAKFYISELLSAIECLHNLNIIYRDLKPENILLDYQGHIALCDFGLCKINMKLQEKTNTFCGTPEYLAPELLLGQGYTRVVDYWTLGTLLYEMLTGLPPFYDDDTSVMYKKILQDPLSFPSFLDSNTKSLIKNLLNRDPTKRLGYNGTQEIKSHPFFQDVDWTKLNQKGYIPPFKPPVQDLNDTSNFDSEFTSEKPADSVVDDFLSESVQKQFGGWTYVGSDTLGNSVIDGSFR